MTTTRVHTFGGFNINDNPPLELEQVEHDLRVLRRRCDVAVVSEFRWSPYWRVYNRLVESGPLINWGSFPSPAVGISRPTWAAQFVLWDRRNWRRIQTKRKMLHRGFAKISESRSLRAALLEERADLALCWFGVTHFVRGGDEKSDPGLHRAILENDLATWDAFLDDLIQTGHPVIFQLDANIHRSSSAGYEKFRRIVRGYHGQIVGAHGIEYLVVFDRHSKTKVDIEKHYEVGSLNTPHEGRAIDFRLRMS